MDRISPVFGLFLEVSFLISITKLGNTDSQPKRNIVVAPVFRGVHVLHVNKPPGFTPARRCWKTMSTPIVIAFAYKNYEVEGNKTRKTVCRTCDAQITDGIATTSNFNRHLQRTHKDMQVFLAISLAPWYHSLSSVVKIKNNLFLLCKTKTVLWSWKLTLKWEHSEPPSSRLK